MDSLTPVYPSRLQGKILLPPSKSLSNRALILTAIAGGELSDTTFSDCDDTRVMVAALKDRPETIDIGAAGTAMRFLTAYFAIQKGESHILTGTERMRCRPIGVLVDALRSLGAKISYIYKECFPPIRVEGGTLNGGFISLPADISSQYISALLMIAPAMKEGLTLALEGTVISRPYIDMTVTLMKQFGVQVDWMNDKTLQVLPGRYNLPQDFAIESDWSAASYWYETVALSPDKKAVLRLSRLKKDSLQGDRVISQLFRPLGVATDYNSETGEAILTKDDTMILPPEAIYQKDLADCPDLAQTLAVTCALLRRPFRFTGLRSLRIKETDRLEALRRELQHFNVSAEIEGNEALTVKTYPEKLTYDGHPVLTYKDHRMAMAFSPAALLFDKVRIANPAVVSKSYPGFWNDITALGL